MDTIQTYAPKYVWFTYEAMHCVVRLMRMHSHVAEVLSTDAALMELFEKCLRQYVTSGVTV